MKEVEKDILTIDDRIERTNLTNRVQSSISDKLWFNIAYHARGNAITDAKGVSSLNKSFYFIKY